MSDWEKLSANLLFRADGAEIHRARTVVPDRTGKYVRAQRYRAAWSAGTLAEGPEWAGPWRETLAQAKRDVRGKRPD